MVSMASLVYLLSYTWYILVYNALKELLLSRPKASDEALCALWT